MKITPRAQTSVFALLSWLIPFLVCLLFSLNSWFIDNKDHIEFLGTANYFAHGNGFVNPVKSVYNVDAPSPIPAFSFRGALYPLILSLFLKISPHLLSLKILNVLLASFAPLLAFFVIQKISNEKVALLGVLLFFTSSGWIFVTKTPWSEPLICIMWLLPLACWILPSPSWAQSLFTGLLAALAWTAKPQLGFFMPLLGIALLATTGWKQLLRNRLYWTTALVYFLCTLSIKLLYHRATGTWPYQAYDAWLGTLSNHEVLMYKIRPIESVIDFMWTNRGFIFQSWLQNLAVFARMILSGYYSILVFLFLPALFDGFKRNQTIPFFISLGVVVLVALNWVLWSITDVARYYLLPMMLLQFLCLMYTQHWIERYFKLVLLGLVLICIPLSAWQLKKQREAYLQDVRAEAFPVLAEHYTSFCSQFNERILAAYNGWNYHVICGNPVVILPYDLDDEILIQKFIEKERPSFILAVEPYKSFEFILNSTQLKPLDTFSFPNMPTMHLYETQSENSLFSLNPVPPLYNIIKEEIENIERSKKQTL